jgi:tetratricopeptide (TPR) repeat protein
MALLRSGDRGAAEAELATYRALYEADQKRTRDRGLAAARIARGRELLQLGRTREAIDHLRNLPESVDSLAALAAALRSSGDLEGAIEALDRAVALDASRTDLRALLNEGRLELLRR